MDGKAIRTYPTPADRAFLNWESSESVGNLQVVDRNLQLAQRVMSYLMTNPNLFEALPDKFELVVLPDDDPELSVYNLDLLDRYGSEARPVVFVRLSLTQSEATPQVFAPVLNAA